MNGESLAPADEYHGLVDVSDLSLRDLDTIDVGAALHRMLGEENVGPVAGFSATV
ncbi:hypothetical protein [Planobispora rosea]|uniref:hypothetical protein n=1 Tax=Planobispora rosea TaxID=35762 RepID=UPI00159F0275|nr:hypothetical protein [Planobispora rosea]